MAKVKASQALARREDLEEKSRVATIRLLNLLNSGNSTHEIIESLLSFFRELSGCVAVGVRLACGDDFPYYESCGFPSEFIASENSLCMEGADGEPLRDAAGRVLLGCMCGCVLSERTDQSMPCFTANGSFWTNSTSDLVGGLSREEFTIPTRNVCLKAGYESLALVPLRHKGKIVGLIQFNDRCRGRFTPEFIGLVEQLAESMAIAVVRRREEESLREREERFRAMIAGFDGLMFICSPDYRIEFQNEAMQKRNGFDSSGQLCYQALHGLEAPCSWCPNERVFAGETVRWVLQSPKDQRWYEATSSPLRRSDGSVWKQSMVVDVTERKLAEDALRESEERYRSLVEHTPDGIVVHADWKFAYVNPAALRLFGAESEDQLLGKPILEFLHKDSYSVVMAQILHIYDGKDQPPLVEERAIRLDGETLAVETVRIPITFQGKPAVQVVIRDITERKRAEQEIYRLNSELEQRVAQRTADLVAAIQDQEAFSYSVSHDLRAPLRHINSFSSILIEDHRHELSEEACRYLDRICSASSQMGSLIDHLLELSRVTRTEIKRERVDLSRVVGSTLAMFRETEPERIVEWVVEQDVTVVGDDSLLWLLFQNLLGNAWKYTAREPLARIEFGSMKQAEEEIYFVRDNGVGFDMAYASKLFDPFERLHGSEFEGAGVGLATAWRIVQRHGGRLWGEGVVGEGATFYLTLQPKP